MTVAVEKNNAFAKTETKYCVCRTLGPILTYAKIFGYFPVIWYHVNDECTYTKSVFWLIYTVFALAFQILLLITNVNYDTLFKLESLLLFIDNITNAIYSHYVVFCTILGLFLYPSYIRTLNKLVSTLKNGEFCQSAMKQIVTIEYAIFGSLGSVYAVQFGIFIWLNNSTNSELHFSALNMLYRMYTNFSFGLYAVLFTLFALLIGSLACFEKFTLNCIKYVPVHPLSDIDETNNSSDFMGVVHYKLCNENHPCTKKIFELKQAEVVENLRIYHEEFSLCIYEFNKCMDIHFLTITIIELGILIIDWYAVVAYLVYKFKDPRADTINVVNVMFVISHTYGLFLFLKNCQHLKNMIHGLINFLLEYSTRITDPEEHQQVRFFIEKINHHRPFTASGVFTIDLGIAGPISANILTYVLVALQFEIPKEEF